MGNGLLKHHLEESIDQLRHEMELLWSAEREARKQADDAERDMRKVVADITAAELKKQATEYERRLDGLNHENARVAAAGATSLRQDIFDQYRNSQAEAMEVRRKLEEAWERNTERRLIEIETAAQERDRTTRLMMAVIGLTLAAGSLAVKLWG